MIYLNENTILKIGIDWEKTIDVIRKTTLCLDRKDFSQPIKLFLRFRNPKNRIIAMPAFVGGKFDIAGIKWVSSFPRNIYNNIPRAHSIFVLNDSKTGIPIAMINTNMLSIIRTTSVSGLILSSFNYVRNLKNLNIGIIGWGPIGQHHYKLVTYLFRENIQNVSLYDIRKIDPKTIPARHKNITRVVDRWEDAYKNKDIVITCTVSDSTYINKKPKKGALLLNISLRDYKTSVYDYVKDGIIVDDWEEVCRENTDIENFYLKKGLKKEKTFSIIDVLDKNILKSFPKERTIMFNPMGMAVFDVAIAKYYLVAANSLKLGVILN